jgi:hypothetical protein
MNPPTDKLPDPWLFESEALIRELDRCRELTNQIPTNGDSNATYFGIRIAVNAQWNLRENLRHLLHLHREEQRATRRQQEDDLAEALSKPAPRSTATIVPLRTPTQRTGKTPNNNNARTHSTARESFAKRRRAQSPHARGVISANAQVA